MLDAGSNVWFSPVIGKFLGILVGQDPSDSKSNRLYFDSFRFCSHPFEVYSVDSFKMIGDSPEVSNFNRLFLKLGSSATNRQFSRSPGSHPGFGLPV